MLDQILPPTLSQFLSLRMQKALFRLRGVFLRIRFLLYLRKRDEAAIMIQKNVRGMNLRATFVDIARNLKIFHLIRHFAAKKIQSWYLECAYAADLKAFEQESINTNKLLHAKWNANVRAHSGTSASVAQKQVDSHSGEAQSSPKKIVSVHSEISPLPPSTLNQRIAPTRKDDIVKPGAESKGFLRPFMKIFYPSGNLPPGAPIPDLAIQATIVQLEVAPTIGTLLPTQSTMELVDQKPAMESTEPPLTSAVMDHHTKAEVKSEVARIDEVRAEPDEAKVVKVSIRSNSFDLNHEPLHDTLKPAIMIASDLALNCRYPHHTRRCHRCNSVPHGRIQAPKAMSPQRSSLYKRAVVKGAVMPQSPLQLHLLDLSIF